MRIILQQRQSGLYFKDIGSWVPNSSEAMDFVSSSAAIDFCVSNKLSDLQVVLKFEDQRYEIVLPMTGFAEQPGDVPRERGSA